ncbi:MAG: phosphotransferase [bacterium]|nr:phosphotransferase [bacterium]
MRDVQKILAEYELVETSPVCLLRDSPDNEVFVVGEKDKKILRISKRLPIEDIKFEYEATEYLFKQGLPVPSWVRTKSDSFYTLSNGAVAVIFDFLSGHHIQVDKNHLPTTTQAFNAGKGLGLLSNKAIVFTPSTPRKRNIFSELERALTLSDVFVKNFEGGEKFVSEVKDAINFAKSQKETAGLIHNDYRPSNVFFNDNDDITGIIDFDWSCVGPLVKDLALAVVEWSFPDGQTEADFTIFDAFLDGYNSVANIKWKKDKKLYSWIKFATLSDAATYFCDLLENSSETNKLVLSSYMYQKYLFFSDFLI